MRYFEIIELFHGEDEEIIEYTEALYFSGWQLTEIVLELITNREQHQIEKELGYCPKKKLAVQVVRVLYSDAVCDTIIVKGVVKELKLRVPEDGGEING